jgi:hypothetical protein
MTYLITLPNGDAPKEYQKLDAAKDFANKKAKELEIELEVVDVDSSVVMHVATYVEGRYFHPWERVETPKFSAPHFEGWRPAYNRKRIEATVYRSYDEEAELPWMVHDGRTGGTRLMANTVVTRQLLTSMRQGLTL